MSSILLRVLLPGRQGQGAARPVTQRRVYALDHGIADFRDELIESAWEQPVARRYRETGLLEQTVFALCGPTSLAQVLRSAGIAAEPGKVLDDTPVRTLFGARLGGMSLDQVAEVLAIKSKQEVATLRDLELPAFRAELAGVNDPRRRYIANFNRRPLFGWGGGHHSPIGAYLEAEDALLILDVNGGVGPWLVSVARFHQLVSTRDAWMTQSRGLARLTLAD